MPVLDPSQPAPGRELKSALALAGLHASDRDPDRTLAWVNSVCFLFLVIGVAGSRPAGIDLQPLSVIEEAVAAVAEPLPPPPQTQTEPDTKETTDNPQTDAPQIVAVSLETPATAFAVPTVGNLLVPSALAQAPPVVPMKAPTALRVAPPPLVLNNTGKGGERPVPPYPKIALEQGQQGTVRLRLEVNTAGAIVSVAVQESSGFPILDRSAVDFVKRHWTVPTANTALTYEATINYRLSLN